MKICTLLGLALLPNFCFAEVSLPKLFSDGMVLQRHADNPIWGWAEEGEAVKLTLNGNDIGETVTQNGKWIVSLKGLKAGGPHTLEIKGANTITLKDVYFGDLWLASGQSNMENHISRTLERFPDVIEKANHPLIREFKVPKKLVFSGPVEDFDSGDWEKSVGENILDNSAVAYFFAKKVQANQNIPIGILNASFGGSPAECWINEQALKDYPKEYQQAMSFKDEKFLKEAQEKDAQNNKHWFEQLNSTDAGLNSKQPWYHQDLNDSQWQSTTLPGPMVGTEPFSGSVWARKTITLPNNIASQEALLRLGTIVNADETYVNGTKVGNVTYEYPPRRYPLPKNLLKPGKNTIAVRVSFNNTVPKFIKDKPYYLQVGSKKINLEGEWLVRKGTVIEANKPLNYVPWSQPLGCFNGMLAPLTQMNITGVIWYQGESNATRPEQYRTLFPHLISHWREQWQRPNLPFLFVQLPNFMEASLSPQESQWAELRDAQLHTLQTTNNTAMVTAIDAGEWNDIHPTDKKTVGERLALAALALVYKQDVVYSGPQVKEWERKGNKIYLGYEHKGSGLVKIGNYLQGFALADDDGKFHWAKARIEGNHVVVWHPKITAPKSLRYAWADNPSTANLYNKEGLPATPFQLDLK